MTYKLISSGEKTKQHQYAVLTKSRGLVWPGVGISWFSLRRHGWVISLNWDEGGPWPDLHPVETTERASSLSSAQRKKNHCLNLSNSSHPSGPQPKAVCVNMCVAVQAHNHFVVNDRGGWKCVCTSMYYSLLVFIAIFYFVSVEADSV